MKYILPVAIIWLSLCLYHERVLAQSVPPTQTINTNQGVACNALGSQGPVSLCQSGWSYGCSSTVNGQQIVATDGMRTSILFQDTGAVPIVLVFGDQAAGANGFVVQPGNSFLWSNLGVGNAPGRVPTTSVSIDSNGDSTCTFLFTD